MFSFVRQWSKALALTIFAHMYFSTKSAAKHSSSNISDNSSIVDSTVQNSLLRDSDGFFSNCKHLENYDYSTTYMTYMMNLRLCNLLTNGHGFGEKCHNSFIERLRGYHQLIHLKFCNESAYQDVCGTSDLESPDQQNFTAILIWWTSYNEVTVPANDLRREIGGNMEKNVKENNRKFCFYIESYFNTLVKGYEPMWSTKNVFNTTKLNQTFDFRKPFLNPHYSEIYVTDSLCESICPVVFNQTDNGLLSRFGCYPSQCKAKVVSILFSYSLLAIAIISTNTLVLIIAWKTNLLSTVSGLFRIHLAIADLLVGVSVIPAILGQYSSTHFSAATYAPVVRYTAWSKSTMESRLSKSSTAILYLFVSLYTLCIASIDRYLAITRPLLYRQGKYFNKKRVNLILGLGWMIGLLLAISGRLSGLDTHRLILDLFSEPVSILAFLVSVVVVLLLTWIFNGLTLRHIRKYYKERKKLFAEKIHPTKEPSNAISTSSVSRSLDEKRNNKYGKVSASCF